MSDHSYMTKLSQRALLLALAGLASAVFTIATSKLAAGLSAFYPGLVFGVAIAAVFVLHGGVRSPFKPIGFIAASTAAFPISIFAAFGAFGLYDFLFGARSSGRVDIPLPVPFAAGSVGAFIIFFAAFVFFGPANATWRSIGRPALSSLIGGVLGVIGWVISDAAQSQSGASNGDPMRSPALYVIWQTGVALCVAFVVPVEDRQAAPPVEPARRSMAIRIIAGLFFVAILAFFGWQIYGNVQSARASAKWDAERRQMIAEAPSIEGLPPIQARTPEQAVIEEDFGGYFAQEPRMGTIPGGPGSAGYAPPTSPRVSYTLLYQRQKQPPFGYGGVVVTIDQYPNSAWARYKAKYPNPMLGSWGPLPIVARFENRVYVNSSQWYPNHGGTIFFHWPSGAVAVNIRYEASGSINEEFLKRYLDKYPSSLGPANFARPQKPDQTPHARP